MPAAIRARPASSKRKHVLLSVVGLLQAMLAVRRNRYAAPSDSTAWAGSRGELAETREHRQQAPVAECGGSPAPHHLERLRGELDLPRIPPGPCFTLCSMPLRATSCSITTFSERSDWRVPKSM